MGPPSSNGALARLAAVFLDDLRGVRADLTVEAYRDELVAIVRDASILGLPPDPKSWTEREVTLLKDNWGGLAPKSVHKRAAVLASFLSFNGNDVVLGMRRRGRLRLPPATRGPVRLTDPAARARLFERASPTQRMAMFLGFGLGLRLGEICGLRLRDLQGGDLLVRRAKGGGTRAVPVSGPIGAEVRAYVEGHRASLIEWARLQGRAAEDPGTLLVHVHRGEPRPYTPDGLGDSLRDLGASVGVRFSPHDMRRTFATELAERSVGLEVIQVALGHEMLETTRDYVQVRERRLREALTVHQGLVLAEMGTPGEQGPATGPAAGPMGPLAGRGPDRRPGRAPRSKVAVDAALARAMEAFLLDREAAASKRTVQGDRGALAAILRDATALGLPADLSRWTERDVLALRRRWDCLAPTTMHGRASILGAFLSFHGNDVVLGMRRRRRLPLPPAKRGIVRVTDEATRRLLFAHADPTQRAAMALGFGLGLRAGEMCALRPEDIRDGNVVVRCGKGGRLRAVPLTPEFEAELRAYVADHRARLMEWARLEGREAQDPGTLLVQICHRAPRAFTSNALGASLRQLGRGLGVRFSPHDMRRAFATELADREVGLEVIQVALGHVNLGTTRDYVQVKQRRLREAMDGYQGAVCAEIGPRAG